MNTTFKERLIVEADNLKENINKLSAFIEGDLFNSVDAEQQVLLRMQLATMQAYHTILDARILFLDRTISETKQSLGIVEYKTKVFLNKFTRKIGDEIVQLIKAMERSEEHSIAKRKFTEGVMWLGMDLKRLGETNPYPESKNPANTTIEKTADNLKL